MDGSCSKNPRVHDFRVHTRTISHSDHENGHAQDALGTRLTHRRIIKRIKRDITVPKKYIFAQVHHYAISFGLNLHNHRDS
jgi:hypothetical protein